MHIDLHSTVNSSTGGAVPSCHNYLGNFVSSDNSITAYRLPTSCQRTSTRDLIVAVRAPIFTFDIIQEAGDPLITFIKKAGSKIKRKTEIAHYNTVENPRMPSVNCSFGGSRTI